MKIDLIKKLPNRIFEIINLVSKAADRADINAYIVGGPVRDIILNVANYDLDFVVETDAIEFASALNKSIKGTLVDYMAFKTATINLSDFRIDIATARSESYKRPAAYPTIIVADIKQDLFRRDFTINAMAVSINKNDFGMLKDFYNGYKDLKKGIIRVMHDKSFIDDPTRIFRAVRFSARFNFKIANRTKKLIREALLAGYLGEVNQGRIRKEIELFLQEKDPAKCLEQFSKLV